MRDYEVEIFKVNNVTFHNHDDVIGFIYVLDGGMDYQVSFETHRMHTDDYVLINAGEFHAMQALDEYCTVAYITVSLEWLRQFFPYEGYTLLVCDVFSEELDERSDLSQIEHLRKKLKRIIYRYAMDEIISDELIRQMFEYIHAYFTISDFLLDNDNPLRKTKEQVYNETYKLIDENYWRRDCMQYVINHMYYSQEYLNRIFRAFLGSGLQEGINNIRCWQSEDFLVLSDMNVIDIAERCGFSDSKYYYKYFKRWYGMTPTEFRKKWKENRERPNRFRNLEKEEIGQLFQQKEKPKERYVYLRKLVPYEEASKQSDHTDSVSYLVTTDDYSAEELLDWYRGFLDKGKEDMGKIIFAGENTEAVYNRLSQEERQYCVKAECI
ncbi:MAG: AraC family transcriptional regulator [Clostridiales bacterium]|nr:AraC family transcriptional regulator [Clostridiales bacterium]